MALKTPEPFPLQSVNDRQCIHVTYDGRRCEAIGSTTGPHGWLCDYHSAKTAAYIREVH